MTNGFQHSISIRPAVALPRSYGFERYPSQFRPFRPRTTHTVDRQERRGTGVVALFTERSPTAVPRAVALFVVDTIECVLSRGSATDVGEECLELQPAFANRDAASSVVRVVGDVRIAATLQHRLPDTVLSTLVHAVLCRASACCFVAQTAAATCSLREVVRSADVLLATAAGAQPTHRVEFLDQGKTAEQSARVKLPHSGSLARALGRGYSANTQEVDG